MLKFILILHEQDGVAVPCFLKHFSIPIVRAGQQLKVLKKLLELCNYDGSGDYTYEDFLPSWSGYISNHLFCASPMTFSKGYLEAMMIARNNYYTKMQEKLEKLSTKLKLRYQQVMTMLFFSFFLNFFAAIDGKIWKFD